MNQSESGTDAIRGDQVRIFVVKPADAQRRAKAQQPRFWTKIYYRQVMSQIKLLTASSLY